MDWIKSRDFILSFPYEEREYWTHVVKSRAGEGMIRARAQVVIERDKRADGSPVEVPPSLWSCVRHSRQDWLAGDFITDPHPLAANPFPIKAYGVEFYRPDLELAGFPKADVEREQAKEPERPKERYARDPNPQQKRVAKFFAMLEARNVGLNDKTQSKFYADYLAWNGKEGRGQGKPLDPLKETAFKDWLRRWRSGERW